MQGWPRHKFKHRLSANVQTIEIMASTSPYFSVQLPLDITDEQSARIYAWGKQNCLQSNIVRENNGEGFLLIVERADERDTRNRQRLMLTNYKHWGIDASKQPKGWLKVLTAEEFNALNNNPRDRYLYACSHA